MPAASEENRSTLFGKHTGLPIPANSEITIEGEVLPDRAEAGRPLR